MRASSKTVLYVRTKSGAKVEQHPVAVFPNEGDAGSFAVALHTAVKNSDAARIKELFPKVPCDEAGKPHEIVKYIRVELPYSPPLFSASDDIFGDASSATS